jgi:uncharacterized membrane protein HdeD (DUF308 family)
MSDQGVIIYFSDRERLDLAGMSKWFRGLGLALLLLGVLAVVLPYFAALSVEIIVGLVLLLAGAVHLVHVFQSRRWRRVTWEIILTLLFILAGVFFLAYPFRGLLTLTILLGVFFLIHGGFTFIFAMGWKPRPGWGWMLTGGIISVFLGIIVITGLPGTAGWVIGLILGLDLFFTGLTMLILGSDVKKIADLHDLA